MQLENLNVEKHEVLITPEDLKALLPSPKRFARPLMLPAVSCGISWHAGILDCW